MKQRLESLLRTAIETLTREGVLPSDLQPRLQIERSRDPRHGDFATNLALLLAGPSAMPPRRLAERLVAAMPADALVAKVEIAGPGFINFFLDPLAQFAVVRRIAEQGNAYGLSQVGAGHSVQVEFVSANPTGPLHVGHGRGAAYGSAVASLLKAVGFTVEREYYVNDAGRQMDILAASVYLRYLEACGEALPAFPANAYRGAYVQDIAADLKSRCGESLRLPAAELLSDLPPDEPAGGDKEEYIDAVVERVKERLGAEGFETAFRAGLDSILADIREDLAAFGVEYDRWYSERSLVDTGAIRKALDRLQAAGHLYEKDGALWFASTRHGDEKDRVVVRDNGQTTYFASDIAYHLDKLERGYQRVINVWGADHHGYIPRVKAALAALGADPQWLEVLLVQFAVLYRGTEKVQMSTRSGEFVTLRELREEVGKDPCRFFYLMRKSEQHMDFDLELAKSESNENPVYYVQYAHARICSVFRQLDERGLERDPARGDDNLTRLTESHEQALLTSLTRYPEVLERAALAFEPHQLVQLLRDLAHEFHTYYNAHQFLVEDAGLRDARLNLVAAIRQVLYNGLTLLGISAPSTM